MFLFSQKGDIIVQGDYNVRTGDIQETVLDDDNAFRNVLRTMRMTNNA